MSTEELNIPECLEMKLRVVCADNEWESFNDGIITAYKALKEEGLLCDPPRFKVGDKVALIDHPRIHYRVEDIRRPCEYVLWRALPGGAYDLEVKYEHDLQPYIPPQSEPSDIRKRTTDVNLMRKIQND